MLALLINEKFLLPFINWYADTVHCHNPFGYTGISVMWYSLFVGMPLFFAFLISVVTVPIGYKGLIHKQFPPKGMKVYKPTEITRGWKGYLKSIFHLLIPTFLILIAIWGYFQVNKMPHDTAKGFDYRVCKN